MLHCPCEPCMFVCVGYFIHMPARARLPIVSDTKVDTSIWISKSYETRNKSRPLSHDTHTHTTRRQSINCQCRTMGMAAQSVTEITEKILRFGPSACCELFSSIAVSPWCADQRAVRSVGRTTTIEFAYEIWIKVFNVRIEWLNVICILREYRRTRTQAPCPSDSSIWCGDTVRMEASFIVKIEHFGFPMPPCRQYSG